MLDRLLLPELRAAVAERDWPTLAAFGETLHPRTVALIIDELEDREEQWEAFSHLDGEHRPAIFEGLPPALQDDLVARLPKGEIADLLEQMSHDDRADLVKRMDEERQEELLPLVAKADREDIRKLIGFAENTAGSRMTTDYASVPQEITVAEALQRLRREAPDRETIYYIYIIDRRRQLVGFVSLKDLILANPGRTIGAVMRTDVISCSVDMPVGEVAKIFGEFDLLALPVLDADRQLVGIITYDDALDIQEEEATDDVHRLGAVGPLRGEYLATPLFRVIRSRLVWLTMLFLAELLTGGVLYHYQHLTTMFVILTIFMPVITATGGNSGSQAASLVTRAVALGEIELSDWRRIAWREILSGLALGACVGLLGGITAMLIYREKAVIAVILLTSLVAVTTAGSLTGSLLPLVFKRFGMDPAISSGPFVASMVDVLGLALYLSIAHYVLLIF